MSIIAVGENTQHPYNYKTEDAKNHSSRAIPRETPRNEKPLVEEPKDEYTPSEDARKENADVYRLVEDEKGYKLITAREEGGGAAMNTDRVDDDIKQLKSEKQQLEQQLTSVRDEEKRRDLEQRLSQITSELNAKDNDAHRRSNADATLY